MKLSEAREAYYDHSGKASDQARALALAGIAVVWIFRIGDGAAAKLDADFLGPLLCLVIGLALDFAQYVLAALIWGSFHRLKERQSEDLTVDIEVTAPPAINYPSVVCFWSKLVAVSIGSVWLIRLIAGRWL
ncbi:MAG: hypothetical protein K2R93_16600 [Gemmatimonadaceae bacterium]|nr:hypothetical protein [Gemmatimonadaceae bacterium]